MKEDLKLAPENSIILMQTCGHNPTGHDLTDDQWEEVVEIVKERNLFPFFIMSWQGFISGDLDIDAYAIRLFSQKGVEFFSAQSYEAKFGLYCKWDFVFHFLQNKTLILLGERTGNMTAVVSDAKCVKAMKAQLSLLCRMLFSNPSYYGAKLICHILENPMLFSEW